jgi:glycosyltransferase involved in cell wall biosynthesis
MHLLYVNPYCDRDLDDPDRLLERYRSTRRWCAAAADQGVGVTVWQAFPAEARRELDGVDYRFVPFPRRPDRAWPDAIADLGPDLVHLDGLVAPLRLFRLLEACRRAGVPALVQDHGGCNRPGPSWRAALALGPRPAPSALLFSAAAQADPWLAAGIFPRGTRVLEVMESSTEFTPVERSQARAALGLDGDPLVASVGRLNRGKDPATLLDGFAALARSRPGARLALAYHEAPLLRQVERRIAASPLLAGRVSLLGRLEHGEVRQLLSAADIFASASRSEGSGYAALEAMACGALPVLSDIPSFRAMTGGRVGVLFPAADAPALGRALEQACRSDASLVLDHFRRELGPEALGRKIAAAYNKVAQAPSGSAGSSTG